MAVPDRRISLHPARHLCLAGLSTLHPPSPTTQAPAITQTILAVLRLGIHERRAPTNFHRIRRISDGGEIRLYGG